MLRIRVTNTLDVRDWIYFDLLVDSERRPLRSFPSFGFSGSLNQRENGYPLLLLEDGTIDLGAFAASQSRFHKTNLYDRVLRVGEYVTVWWRQPKEEAITFRIDSVTEIGDAPPLGTLKKGRDIHPSELAEIRAEVIQSFEFDFNGETYSPPIGVQGSVSIAQGELLFWPDGVIVDGDQINTPVNPDEIRILSS